MIKLQKKKKKKGPIILCFAVHEYQVDDKDAIAVDSEFIFASQTVCWILFGFSLQLGKLCGSS